MDLGQIQCVSAECLRLVVSSAGSKHPASLSSMEPSPSNTSLCLISQDLVQPYPREESDTLRSVVSGHLILNSSFDVQNQSCVRPDALTSELDCERCEKIDQCNIKTSFYQNNITVITASMYPCCSVCVCACVCVSLSACVVIQWAGT